MSSIMPTSEIPALPPRAPTTHKGQAGHVVILAGSVGMSGAAVLAGLGALRGGAGLVRVLTPADAQPLVAVGEPSLMVIPLPPGPGGVGVVLPRAVIDGWAHVLAVGPGLGTTLSPADVEALLVHVAHLPCVIDADALNALAQLELDAGSDPPRPHWWDVRSAAPTVITPHPGEMARLRRAAGLTERTGTDDAERIAIAHEYAACSGLIVVLKGHRTVVCTPTESYVNTTGNPGMATGGMGDVLTGIVAALLAQGLPPFDAARLAVYAHGLAADHCAAHVGTVGYLAREVATAVPQALVRASQPRMGFC